MKTPHIEPHGSYRHRKKGRHEDQSFASQSGESQTVASIVNERLVKTRHKTPGKPIHNNGLQTIRPFAIRPSIDSPIHTCHSFLRASLNSPRPITTSPTSISSFDKSIPDFMGGACSQPCRGLQT